MPGLQTCPERPAGALDPSTNPSAASRTPCRLSDIACDIVPECDCSYVLGSGIATRPATSRVLEPVLATPPRRPTRRGRLATYLPYLGRLPDSHPHLLRVLISLGRTWLPGPDLSCACDCPGTATSDPIYVFQSRPTTDVPIGSRPRPNSSRRGPRGASRTYLSDNLSAVARQRRQLGALPRNPSSSSTARTGQP